MTLGYVIGSCMLSVESSNSCDSFALNCMNLQTESASIAVLVH